MPDRRAYDYTFANIATTIAAFTEQISGTGPAGASHQCRQKLQRC
jgi:hypothetical protein